MHNIDGIILAILVSVFTSGFVGIWAFIHKRPKRESKRPLADEVFLDALTYDEYKSVRVVRDEVMEATGDYLIDPASVHSALERLEEDGKAERRMRKRFVEMRTRETPEYRRASDLRLEDFGVPRLILPEVPRQSASRW